jgi:OTT_1508-like deaminase
LPSGDFPTEELQRRFLDSLSYVCDYKKGGDTTTAIAAASAPLTYYIASNKDSRHKVEPFLRDLLSRLGGLYNLDSQRLRDAESSILRDCVDFSEKRVNKYSDSLQKSLTECLEASSEDLVIRGEESFHQAFRYASWKYTDFLSSELRALEDKLGATRDNLVHLCLYCHTLRRTSDMDHIKQKATQVEHHGETRNPFATVRHFVGRLEYHVKAVKTLVFAALRIPGLFEEPEIHIVKCPRALISPPGVRNKLRLDGIAHRMISNDKPQLLRDVQARLQNLDQGHGIEDIVRRVYAEKQPRVHAELILLEHFHRNTLDFVGNDRYIGCSKPACYCCLLYIREHPGHFVEPASHQKIYLNWMPPTSTPEVRDPNSRMAEHERNMLNKMVETIRTKTIDQIMTRTGRRRKHYDSVTGDTRSTLNPVAGRPLPQGQETYPTEADSGKFKAYLVCYILTKGGSEHYESANEMNEMARNLSLSPDPSTMNSDLSTISSDLSTINSDLSASTADSDVDSDEEGGVSIL